MSRVGRWLRMCVVLGMLAALSSLSAAPASPQAENTTKPGDFWTEPATLVSLGFEWRIAGDENRNAGVEVSYRKKGQQEWQKALPLVRSQHEQVGATSPPNPNMHPDPFDYAVPNMFAGSILNLEPGTE